jgi:hypothetical protein
MNKRLLFAAVVVAVVSAQFLFAGCKRSESPGERTTPEQAHQKEMLNKSFEESKKVIAVNVNGTPISEFFVLREMNVIAPQYLKPDQKRTPDLDAKIRRDAITIVITQELAVQDAKKRGIQIQPAAIDRELQKMKAATASEGAFQKFLESNGLTAEELKKVMENELLFERIASLEVDAKIDLSDSVLKERYDREKAGRKDSAHQQMTFEAAKGMLGQQVRAEAMEKRMKAWEKELRKNARIEIIRP